MFKDDNGDLSAGGRGGKRKRERERHDPQKTMKPREFALRLILLIPTPKQLADNWNTLLAVPPVVGPGKGGRVGSAATQHLVNQLQRDTTRDVDVSRTRAGFNRLQRLSLSPLPHADLSHPSSRSLAKRCSSTRQPRSRTTNGPQRGPRISPRRSSPTSWTRRNRRRSGRRRVGGVSTRFAIEADCFAPRHHAR